MTTEKTFTYRTMADVRAANKTINHHWFERGAMKFFNSRIESELIAGEYFITSEQYDEDRSFERLFSVRRAESDGRVQTVGEFQGYRTKQAARDAITELLKRA